MSNHARAEALRRLANELDEMSDEIEETPSPDWIEAARAEADELLDQTQALRGQRDALRLELEELAERRQAVADILDFYEGKLTHVVRRGSAWSAPEILTLSEALRGRKDDKGSRASTDFRLLGLRPDERGIGLVWGINQYADGSGRWTGVAVFRSLEEAEAEVREQFALDVDAWRESGGLHTPMWRKYAEMPTVFEWPHDLVSALTKAEVKDRVDKIREARRALADAEAAPAFWATEVPLRDRTEPGR